MHMQRGNKQTIINNQQGMAALVVVMVMMFVISVTVLGFAQVVRREQRSALDNQLATQAYYAAESGLNLAQDKVKQLLASGTTPPTKDHCSVDAGYGFTAENFQFKDSSHADQNAEITCMLIDPELDTLDYQEVGMTAVPFLVKSSSTNIEHIFVSWESTNPLDDVNAGCDGGASFEPGPSWDCPQPLLRLDIVPVEPGMTATTVASAQYTTFLSPAIGLSSPISYARTVNNLNQVHCNASTTPRKCKVRIDVPSHQAFALRIMSIYGSSNVTVSATSNTGPVKLIGGQVEIDVTARAADVLKRLQARMPVGGSDSVPDFAITAGGAVCKRYQISGGVPSIEGDGVSGPTGANQACATN